MGKRSESAASDRPGGGIDNRSKVFAQTGHGLAWLMLATFALLYAAVEIGTARWKSLIFGDLPSLGQSCTLAIDLGPGFGPAKAQPIPHPGQALFDSGVAADKVRLRYDCTVPALPAGPELSFAHWGWVVGDRVEVKLDGQRVAEYSGQDKPAFPVRGGEAVQVLVETTASKGAASGFIGQQPAVVATGFRQNTLVMGVEVLVALLRSLNFLLPLLSLGMMVSLAWFSGYRVRTLTMAMFLLTCMTIFRVLKASVMFVDSPLAIVSATLAAHCLYGLAFCAFMMETCRVLPKLIYPICRVGTLAMALLGSYLAFHPNISAQFIVSSIYLCLVALWLGSVAIAAGLRQVQQTNRSWTVSFGAGAAFVSALIYAWDFYRCVNGDFNPLSAHLDGVVPIAASLFLLISFSRSEKKFQMEKKTSTALSRRVAIEQSKHETLARFLPLSLVNRFNDHGEIEGQLQLLLEPRRAKVAIFQADLRGFSRLVGDFELNEVLKLLSACFGPVVDHAQKFAMIKVVGDCLFAFVEEQPGEKSPTDYCLDIASVLLKTVDAINAGLKEDQHLRFGIGINYGETFVGNLSSENCIDYTAIGDAVNMTARLEEATKDESVRDIIGVNGILMSRPAFENLKFYADCGARSLTLANGLRSYPLFRAAYYLTSDLCAGIATHQNNIRKPAHKTLESAA